ncbi:MAG TPA: tRNA adenosine(34) deaminase TadA [Candidatus Baltobacteraceae bacterium]|nr:tRNA adenosine(34) deaminase TadA [Candidatus Baltobacteraceae bacterium]
MDEYYIRRAMDLAARAEEAGDVPIGAVLVSGDVLVEAKNEKESRPDATAHAEMLLLQQAARTLNAWRLSDATVYVTKEPCVMCAGAMVAARIKRLVYGCPDPKGGAAGSVLDVVRHPSLNHRMEVTAGVLAAETAAQLQEFFRKRR